MCHQSGESEIKLGTQSESRGGHRNLPVFPFSQEILDEDKPEGSVRSARPFKRYGYGKNRKRP
jgi:hypothetical protein